MERILETKLTENLWKFYNYFFNSHNYNKIAKKNICKKGAHRKSTCKEKTFNISKVFINIHLLHKLRKLLHPQLGRKNLAN